MAFYEGSEVASALIDTIIQKLTSPPKGASAPFWKTIQSGSYANEGFVLQSTGSKGTDNLFIRMRGLPNYSGFHVSLMESYTPNAVQGLNGTVVNELGVYAFIYTTTSYPSNAPVKYWLSFDKDKIMLVLTGSTSLSGAYKNILWIGMPERLSNESDSTAACLAMSGDTGGIAAAGYTRLLRDRRKAAGANGIFRTITRLKNKGWGDYFMLPDIFIEGSTGEGYRSRLSGVSPVKGMINVDFKENDEVTKGSRRFTIHKALFNPSVAAYGTNNFPSEYVALEQLQ